MTIIAYKDSKSRLTTQSTGYIRTSSLGDPLVILFNVRPRSLFCLFILFIWVLTSLSTHCISHITMGSWKCRGNQYIQVVKVLYCKLPTNGKQLPAFPLEVRPGTKPRSQRWEARVLLLCHCGPDTLFQLYY